MPRIFEPGAVFQHPDPGCGEEAHLRTELPRLLAAIVELAGEVAVEEHDSLAPVTSVLGASEAENVDAGLPGDLFRFRAEARDGVGEPRAVHVQGEAEFTAFFADRPELVERIHGAHFGRLREAHRARL